MKTLEERTAFEIAAKKTIEVLEQYTKKSFTFKAKFVANTEQSKDYLIFFEPLWLESSMIDKKMDSLSKGYNLNDLSDPITLAKQVALDYYNSNYSIPIDSSKIIQLLREEEKP